MEPTAQMAASPSHAGAPPKRKLRNFLLDRPFQLKYTGMVVTVTAVLCAVLGTLEYRASTETSEVILGQSLADPMYSEPSLRRALEAEFRAKDREVVTRLVVILGSLIVLLGLTGIVITHKVIGPVYKMKNLFREVIAGRLRLAGKLRKGDELQGFFEVYAQMIEALRQRQAAEVAELEAAIKEAEAAGASKAALEKLDQLRLEMQRALD
ncbi:MAG: hypothetical protein HYY06_14565 [Deltaproteobacteria bacterium]|nr:hypothetical protein [Deltaproteobacteria bacterium]